VCTGCATKDVGAARTYPIHLAIVLVLCYQHQHMVTSSCILLEHTWQVVCPPIHILQHVRTWGIASSTALLDLRAHNSDLPCRCP
jgi:hypothetical protein